MSPGRIVDGETGRVLLRVDHKKLVSQKAFEGGDLSLEEFPPGVRGGFRITIKDEYGTTTTEINRRVRPGKTAPLDIETNKGKRVLNIESD